MKLHFCAGNTVLSIYFLFFLQILFLPYGWSQTYTFTNCGATGAIGPTQSQVNTTYASSSTLNGKVTSSNGIQLWTVPVSGMYTIEAWGARGGTIFPSSSVGYGIKYKATFHLIAESILCIVVDQEGSSFIVNSSIPSGSASGGGGSFVYRNTDFLLIAAGGGGGISKSNTSAAREASVATDAANGKKGVPITGLAGGTSGNGGPGVNYAGGGADFISNGDNCLITNPVSEGGKSRIANFLGGQSLCNTSIRNLECPGGFGGGGAASSRRCLSGNSDSDSNGGGGGGYSGGAAGVNSGGGGGSYSSGSGTSSSGTNNGHGRVIITFVESKLPITLKSFTASCQSDVQLEWTTATESNVSHFEVLRSRDGIIWDEVARLNAVGNSSSENEYVIQDSVKFTTKYYKLRSVDNDGTSEDFGPISVQCELNNEAWNIYPVPVSDQLKIYLTALDPIRDVLIIVDENGRLIREEFIELDVGVSIFQLDVHNLLGGNYFLRMKNSSVYLPLKFIKLASY